MLMAGSVLQRTREENVFRMLDIRPLPPAVQLSSSERRVAPMRWKEWYDSRVSRMGLMSVREDCRDRMSFSRSSSLLAVIKRTVRWIS